jgi:hypothetical protein
MRKDVRGFIRRPEAAGLTVESTPGHYCVLRDGKPLRRERDAVHAAVLSRHDPLRRTANIELRKPPSANLSSLSCVLSAYAIVYAAVSSERAGSVAADMAWQDGLGVALATSFSNPFAARSRDPAHVPLCLSAQARLIPR